MESRTQGSRLRTKKNPRLRTDFSRTDPLQTKDKNAYGQGHNAQVFSNIKKNVIAPINAFFFAKFQAFFQENKKTAMTMIHFLTNQKKCCPRDEDGAFSRSRTSKCVLEDSTFDTKQSIFVKIRKEANFELARFFPCPQKHAA